jgi:tetratricopeptide (TPR) repeat protein
MPDRSDGQPPRRGAGAPRTGGSGAPRKGAARVTGRPSAARPARPAGPRPERAERPARPAGPPLPEGTDPRMLPGDVRRELRGLPDPTVDRIAGHLVAAGMLVDDDPRQAYEHAKAAKALASRVGSVREAVGVTAYRAGDFAAALTELKAARRITGLPDHLPLLADCERALGHPERALAYANDPDKSRLDRASQIELAIVVSGARRDLGQPEAAVLALQGRELDSDAVESWTPRLWYAYADALLAAGRTDEAVSWFTAVATIDEDGETDAQERLAAI